MRDELALPDELIHVNNELATALREKERVRRAVLAERAPQSAEMGQGWPDTLRNSCMGDEGRPFGVGFQEQTPNHSMELTRSRGALLASL
ncbi:MAG TPA: hypothetical protein VMK42_15695 [Anaeromyxobacteraceae bacterium]|nr:hypothetical protein [Anaeromyxobacteraceae bacterium]